MAYASRPGRYPKLCAVVHPSDDTLCRLGIAFVAVTVMVGAYRLGVVV